MATTFKVRYKNHCTPQEQISSGGRYYLDSDCGRKLTGDTGTTVTLTAGTLVTGFEVTTTSGGSTISDDENFIYIKNTGTNGVDILVALDGSTYLIALSDGEAFASEITDPTGSHNPDIRIKTASGITYAEYYSASD